MNTGENPVGLSLREPQFSEMDQGQLNPALIEIISDHFVYHRGESFDRLQDIARNRFVHLHGLSLNIAGFDDLDSHYLAHLRTLRERLGAQLISEHLCITGAEGKSTFDLLPFPFTGAMLDHISDRIKQTQDMLGQNLLLENISTYFRFRMDQIPELEFMQQLHQCTGVQFLLDINNLIVNEHNHGVSGMEMVQGLSSESVGAYHLAGHSDEGTFLFDTHDREVPEEVWSLYKQALNYLGPRPTTIERDENIPAGLELMAEAKKATELSERHQRLSEGQQES